MKEIFELLMLVCFGISWPFNLAKSIRTKSTKGKSLVFLIAIFAGYIFGTISKLMGDFSYVIVVYILNLLMVGADLLLYFVHLAREKKEALKA